jgi:glyoxylase-like metal-dependent hydrolase (beta-lactamase superfamily II)
MKNTMIYSVAAFFAAITSVSHAETPVDNVQVAGKLYVFESDGNGFNTKTLFYDDGKEVVAFDAQFTDEYARKAIDFVKTKTQNPVKYLVITHPNADKFNGIAAFRKIGAVVIMSKLSAANLEAIYNYKKYYFVEVAKMFTHDNYPKLPAADITFDDNYEIKMANGGIVVLTELKKSAIATNQTIAFIKTANALIVGDLVHNNVHAWLEGPVINNTPAYNGENWVNVLKTLQTKYSADVDVYGGRGEAGKLSVVVPQQIAYLQKAEIVTKKYLASIGGDKSKVDYAQLQKAFEKAFPSYTLAFMINFGAYGIVASIK